MFVMKNFTRRIAWLSAALAVCFWAAGCTPLLVGGAAAGGYYVGKDERSAGRIADDAGITASINAKYAKDPDVSAIDINVDTRSGVVTLYGSVSSRRAANRAVELARSTKGVRKVISKITVVPAN